jgi:mycothiol synthase
MTATYRPIATQADYTAALRVIERSIAATWPRANMTQAEWEYEWHAYDAPDAAQRACLWLAGDEPVGCLLFSGPTALTATLPGWEELEDQMYAWAEAQRPPTKACYAMALDGDERRTALLQRRGYTCTEIGMNIRARALDTPPPPATLPPGYRIRHLTDADIPARAALYGRAFEDDDLPSERLRAVTQSVTYRADLDLVAVAPEGELAAFATVWHDPANRLGVFEPVGCDPAHQRRGLGRALMLEGLRRLHALGAERVQVSVGWQREPANQLYERTGFAPIDRQMGWKLAR